MSDATPQEGHPGTSVQVLILDYLISHESYHRGQVGWTLKHSPHPLDQKAAFGLWEWGVR